MDHAKRTYTLIRKWLATDNCGNTKEVIQRVKVQDTTSPSLASGPADVIVECDEVPEAVELPATDNCDQDCTRDFC